MFIMKNSKFKIVLTKDEEDIITAECIELPGCITQGKTEAEALSNIRDAIKGYLASLKKHKEKVPIIKEFHLAEISVY